MPKSTIDDLLACYRLAGKLGRAHKIKLIALLSEDIGAKWSHAPDLKVKREKKEKPEEGRVA